MALTEAYASGATRARWAMGGRHPVRLASDPVTTDELQVFGAMIVAILVCFACGFECLRRCHNRQFARYKETWRQRNEMVGAEAWAGPGGVEGGLQSRFPPVELRPFQPWYAVELENRERIYRVA